MQRDKRYLSTFGFIDLLFNMLVGFVFLFFIAYILINPIADEGKVDPPDVAMVVVNWDRDSKLDVDIWVKDPLNNILSFTNKNVPGMHLERDDLGFQNDILNGKVIGPASLYPPTGLWSAMCCPPALKGNSKASLSLSASWPAGYRAQGCAILWKRF